MNLIPRQPQKVVDVVVAVAVAGVITVGHPGTRAPNSLDVWQNRELASVRGIRLAPRSGERPTREARRERGAATPESVSAPLPSPLPAFAGRGNRTVPGRRNSWVPRLDLGREPSRPPCLT
jgi:hypothetical protein